MDAIATASFKEGIQTYNIRLVCTVIRYIQYLQLLDSTATCRIKSRQEVNYNIQVDTVFTLHTKEPGEKFTVLTAPEIIFKLIQYSQEPR